MPTSNTNSNGNSPRVVKVTDVTPEGTSRPSSPQQQEAQRQTSPPQTSASPSDFTTSPLRKVVFNSVNTASNTKRPITSITNNTSSSSNSRSNAETDYATRRPGQGVAGANITTQTPATTRGAATTRGTSLPGANSINAANVATLNNDDDSSLATPIEAHKQLALPPVKVSGDRPTVVIKIGSNSLLASDGKTLDKEYLRSIADQIATLQNEQDKRVVIVSSGSCAVGVSLMGLSEKPDSTEEKHALSALGQIHVIQEWELAFAPFGVKCAQLLLTHKDFESFESSQNLTNTLQVLFSWKIVPIVNENDPVAIDELTVGDNDRLSAMLSVQLVASNLVLMTDISGLFDKDPRYNSDAKKIDVIEAVTHRMLEAAGGPSKKGRGGMRSKLESARFAAAGGVTVEILHAKEPRGLARSLLNGEIIGTRLMPLYWDMKPDDVLSREVDEQLEEHRRWVACRQVAGTVTLREGALVNVFDHHSIDLDAVCDITSDVHGGEAVSIVDEAGFELGRGVVQMEVSAASYGDGNDNNNGISSSSGSGSSSTTNGDHRNTTTEEARASGGENENKKKKRAGSSGKVLIDSRDITLLGPPSSTGSASLLSSSGSGPSSLNQSGCDN